MSKLESFITKFGGWTEEYLFYNGEVTLRYAPREHVYYLLRDDGELEKQAGVTTVCHIIDKSDALIPWACKQMATKLLTEGSVIMPDGSKIARQMSYEDYESMVLKAKTAHKETLDEAGEVGHNAHDWIERYIKAVIAKDDSLAEHLLANLPEEDRTRNCCKAALDWMQAHNVRWLGTERKVYSRTYKYAGTMDGLCIVDSCNNPHCCKREFKDRLTICDWKTSNYLYIEYLLQTAAYSMAYMEEYPDQIVTDRWINRLGKFDGEFQSWHAEEETLETDWITFRTCLELTRLKETIEKRVKDKANVLREEIKAEKKAAKEAAEEIEKARKELEREQKKADREAALKEKCKGHDKYKGTRPPRCNGGVPCAACVRKYGEVMKEKVKNESNDSGNDVGSCVDGVICLDDLVRPDSNIFVGNDAIPSCGGSDTGYTTASPVISESD